MVAFSPVPPRIITADFVIIQLFKEFFSSTDRIWKTRILPDFLVEDNALLFVDTSISDLYKSRIETGTSRHNFDDYDCIGDFSSRNRV